MPTVEREVDRRLRAIENAQPRVVPKVSGSGQVPGVLPGPLDHDGTTAGFYGTAPVTKRTVTGAKGANAALASLLTALSQLGLITDSTTA